MICKPCREGADVRVPTPEDVAQVRRLFSVTPQVHLNVPGLPNLPPGPPDIRRAALAARRALHAGCKGGTWCDCQHKPGDDETRVMA